MKWTDIWGFNLSEFTFTICTVCSKCVLHTHLLILHVYTYSMDIKIDKRSDLSAMADVLTTKQHLTSRAFPSSPATLVVQALTKTFSHGESPAVKFLCLQTAGDYVQTSF